jgi:hypothetical protein
MDTNQYTDTIEALVGRAGSPLPALVRPDYLACAGLVELVLASTADPSLRREPWERSPTGLTVVVGSDYGVSLGLEFPAGERAAPAGGWIRSHRNGTAVHWRVTRLRAGWLWELLRAAPASRAAPARPTRSARR